LSPPVPVSETFPEGVLRAAADARLFAPLSTLRKSDQTSCVRAISLGIGGDVVEQPRRPLIHQTRRMIRSEETRDLAHFRYPTISLRRHFRQRS
jgi:hypothetical protein